MSSSGQNKVDMSLDDIIKISKAQKRQQGTRGRGTGQLRGRGQQQRGRGQQQRGRGQVLLRGTTGRGRGVVVRGRGTGAVARGRGKLVAQGQRNTQRGVGRGGTRGRGAPNTSVSPLNRNGLNQRGRGRLGVLGNARGRGSIRGRNQLIFNNSGQRQLLTSRGAAAQHLQLTTGKQAAKLLKEKELAVLNLQQAKKNMQTINQALQKSSRDTVVNQRRGIPNNNQQAGRGRNKLLTGLMRSPSTTRQLINTSVTIANSSIQSPSRGGSNAGRGGKRRGWRRRPASESSSQDNFSIQVSNQNINPVKNEPAQSQIVDQLKMLKPSVPTVYKFQKTVFSTPSTGISLNDRFASSSASPRMTGAGDSIDGRKVFI